MPKPIHCPNCRRPQVPREESGRPTCPDCGAALPSGHFGADPSAESGDPRSSTSVLDFPSTGQPRPSGSITMLRSGLRSEEKPSQGGWMENLFARRAKAPAEQVPPPEGPADRAPIQEPVSPRPSTRSTRLDPPMSGGRTDPAPGPADRAEAARRPVSRASTDRPPGPTERVPVAGIVAVLVVLGTSGVALLRGFGPWANVFYLVTAFLLGVSLLGIVHRRGDRRAFWQGFALFGWGYLAMALAPWPAHPWGLELPTAPMIAKIHARAAAASPDLAATSPETPTASLEVAPRKAAPMFVAGDLDQFRRVGHCLIALLVALVGSGIARWFHRTDLAAV